MNDFKVYSTVKYIYDWLKTRGEDTVKVNPVQLGKLMRVHPATIRRGLRTLENDGYIIRAGVSVWKLNYEKE